MPSLPMKLCWQVQSAIEVDEAFSVVETVTDNVGDLIEDVVDEAEAAAERIRRQRRRRASSWEERGERAARTEPDTPADPEVLGWQPMLLARAQTCADCGAALPRGEQAFAAVTAGGIGTSFACPDCVGRHA